MPSHLSRLSALTRPRILVRAARLGTAEFNRERILRRVIEGECVPAPGQAFDQLFEREATMDEARRAGGAAYSPARHVELLSALICEARLAEARIAA
ncbi:MAG: DUF6477 family protein [Pseudomonadota bacterium]